MAIRQKPRGDELQWLIDAWKSTNHEGKLELAQKNNVTYQTIKGWCSAGVYEPVKPSAVVGSPPPQEPIVVNLPPVKLREFKVKKVKRGDEETQILHTGDGHAGKVTNTFNKIVYRQRMETMYDSIMTITNLHRNMYPINKLCIIDTGDRIQGENPYQGSTIGETEMGVRDQIHLLALPAWIDLICSLKQNFATVEVDFFPGNHGADRLAPKTSNWDIAHADIVKAKLDGQKGITVNVHENFADIIWIGGFRFFCFHGDGIACQQGVPFFALDKKIKAYYIQYGGFEYALGGHFHKRHTDEIGSRIEYFMVSTLVSDDEWALKKLGISSNPSQWTYGVHPKHGVTWRYPLTVDYAFLPHKEPTDKEAKQ